MAESNVPIVKKTRVGILIGRIVRFVFTTISVMISSFVLSIVIELVGVTWFWTEQGTDKSAMMVEQEKVYLGLYAEKNVLLSNADGWVFEKLDGINGAVGKYGGNYLINAWEASAVYVICVVNMLNVFLLRVCVMIFSMPVYLVFGIIGLTRGLVGRELRKWGGGHESASMFHLFLDMVSLGFIVSWMFYLSWPFSINPNIVVLPFAMAFGMFVMATAHRYKKYL